MSYQPRGRRRLLTVAVATLGLVGTSLAVESTAQAAGLLTSATTLTVNQSSQYVGDPATLTSTVKVGGLPGLGLTPTGTVAFAATDSNNNTISLGSVKIGSCFLTTCSVTTTTTLLPLGLSNVSATYSGDTLAKTSSASAAGYTLARPVVAPAGTTYTKDCQADVTCKTVTVYNKSDIDNATGTQITADPSATSNTISISYQTTPLPCSVANAGEVVSFSETATDAGKDVFYTVNGAAADNGFYWDGPSGVTYGHMCYASSTQFTGYTPNGSTAGGWTQTPSDYAHLGPVPFDSGAGAYVGLLPDCGASPVPPCISSLYLATDHNNDGGDQFQADILTPPGDPRTGN